MRARTLVIVGLLVVALLGAKQAHAAPAGSYGLPVASIAPEVRYPVLFGTSRGAILSTGSYGFCSRGGVQTALIDERFTALAVRRGRSSVVALGNQVNEGGRLAYTIWDAACDRAAVRLPGLVEVPPGLEPIGVLHLEASGAMRWLSSRGVVRANPAEDGVARVVVPSAAFVATLPAPTPESVIELISWTVAPDETLFVVARERRDLGPLGYELLDHYVLSITPEGVVTRRTNGLGEPVSIAWIDGLDAVLMSPATLDGPNASWRVLFPGRAPADAFGWIPRFLLDPSEEEREEPSFTEVLGGFVASDTGVAAILSQRFGATLVRPFTFEPARVDLDGDGLDTTAETSLGTDVQRRDTDGDGFEDRLEVALDTSPTDASSSPPALPFDPHAIVAPTFGIALEESRFPIRDSTVPTQSFWEQRATSGLSQWMCGDAVPGSVGALCVHADGREREEHYPYGVLTRAGEHVSELAGATDLATGPRVIRSIATGDSRPMPMWEHRLVTLLPITEREAFATTHDFSDGALASRVVRVVDDRVEVLLDSTTACGLVAPRTCGVALVGWDPVRERVLANVWSSTVRDFDRSVIYEVSDRARYLGDVTAAVEGLRITRVIALASGGYVLDRVEESGTVRPPVRVDPYFRGASRHSYLGVGGPRIGYEHYRRGAFGLEEISYELPPYEPAGGGGGAACFGGWCIPDGASRRIPQPIPVFFFLPREWVTVSDALEPGDVIGWSLDVGTARPIVSRQNANGALVRITREGAVVRWIDRVRLDELMTEADRETPFLPEIEDTVRSVDVSPNRERVCLAVGERTWELTLVDGQPSSMRVADSEAGEACAYREDGVLATVSREPHELRVDGARVPLPEEAVDELRRVDGRWVLALREADSVCANDEGDSARGPTAVALAPAFDGVAWIDPEGVGHVAPSVTRFCDASPSDRFALEGTTWSRYVTLLKVGFPITVRSAPMAVRPDGLVVFGPRAANWTDAGVAPMPSLLIGWHPEYRAEDGEGHASLGPLRRRYTNALDGFAPLGVSGLTALTYVPGPTAEDDWGYARRAGAPYSVEPSEDAGASVDAGTSPPTAGGGGCGCSSTRGRDGASLAVVAFFALGLVRSTRRRGSRSGTITR